MRRKSKPSVRGLAAFPFESLRGDRNRKRYRFQLFQNMWPSLLLALRTNLGVTTSCNISIHGKWFRVSVLCAASFVMCRVKELQGSKLDVTSRSIQDLAVLRLLDCINLPAPVSWQCSHGKETEGGGEFKGGGNPPEICVKRKPGYVPREAREAYVTRCHTCSRGVCSEHGSWKIGAFHCPLCCGGADEFSSVAKETLVLRCVSQAFRTQPLLQERESFEQVGLTSLC